MEIKEALRLKDSPKLALVGAGGKTSALFQIASHYSGRVIITTSTHLSVDQTQWGDVHFIPTSIDNLQEFLDKTPRGIITLTGPIVGERATGLSIETLSWLDPYCSRHCIPILIEADGSKRRPLKAPATHEPAIPGFVKHVMVMVGVSAIGKSLNSEWVHRPEIFSALSGLKLGEQITSQSIVRVLSHLEGGLKNIPAEAKRIIFFNQVDTPVLREVVDEMAAPLLSNFDAVVSGSLKVERLIPGNEVAPREYPLYKTLEVIHAVYEPVAGIILAAGAAHRFGKPKQLLEWHGKPLVRHAARKALEAGLRPVIVVSGAYKDQIDSALDDLPVEIVINPDWHQGQGTSVRVGILALPSEVGAAVFLLADQPQIPVPLIKMLVVKHRETLAPIIAPWVEGRRANPVLFDKNLFGNLIKLEGDAGGRQLFSQYEITRVNWDDPDVFLDVDTPDDYHRLLELDT